MTWRDTLEGLKQEIADVRAQRDSRLEAEEAELKSERDDLTQKNQDLGINELLAEINATLLDGKGNIEMEIAVDLGLSADGVYLQINEIEIRPEREALEQGLVEAFRDELEL